MLFRSLCLLLAVQCAQVYTCEIDLKNQGITSANLYPKLAVAFQTCDMSACTKLDLSENKIVMLPVDVFSTLTQLMDLYLNKNFIGSLPATIFDSLTKLDHLNLDTNAIVDLPSGIFQFNGALGILELGNNAIVSLKADTFKTLKNVYEWDLSGNKIVGLWDFIRSLPNPTGIERLYLDDCGITEFPDLTTVLPKLQILYLGDNFITGELQMGAFNYPEMDRLELAGNDIKGKLPKGLFDKTKMRNLNLVDNDIEYIPSNFFDKLTKLESLYLRENSIVIYEAKMFDKLTALRYLYLGGESTVLFEDGIFDSLTALTSLECHYAENIKGFPAGIFDKLPLLDYFNIPDGAECSKGESTAVLGKCYLDTNGREYRVALNNLVDLVKATDGLSTFHTLLISDDEVEQYIAITNGLTIFAPNDGAFEKLDKATLDSLLDPDNVEDLWDVLVYHVWFEVVKADELKTMDGEEVEMKSNDDDDDADDDDADVVKVSITDNVVFINTAKVTTTDLMAENGVVHVIDAVLIRPGNPLGLKLVDGASNTVDGASNTVDGASNTVENASCTTTVSAAIFGFLGAFAVLFA